MAAVASGRSRQRQLQTKGLEIQHAILDAPLKHVDIPKEMIDEWRGRVLVDLLRRADLLDVAFPHDDDTIGQFQRFLLVMSDKDAGNADVIMQPPQPAP